MRRYFARLVSTASLAAFLGCGPSEPPGPGDPCDLPPPPAAYRDGSSPTAPLVDLALAYNRRDDQALARYAALFDSTLFVRYFRGQHPSGHGAPSWDYAAEQAAFEAYVHDPTVLGAHLSLITAAADTAGAPSDSAGDPAGTVRFILTNVALRVCRDPVNYDAVARDTFYVAARESIAGRPVWRIIRWKDETR